MKNELIIRGLTKSFGSKVAVGHLDITIKTGEVHCLLGSNGAGKTTTFNMLLGKEKPNSGFAKLNGINLSEDFDIAREHIFYLPENINLYPELSGVENINYLASLASLSLTQNQIEEALLECGLQKESLHKQTQHYSKGMRQKTALALAKLKSSRLLLLDEPTSGLDPVATRDFVHLIKTLSEKGAMTLMITHDLSCAHLLADQITILHRGNALEAFNNPASYEQLESKYLSAISA